MKHSSTRKKYDPDITPQLAEQYARDGYLDKQIAEILGVSAETFSRWSKKHIQLGQALKRGREVANVELKQAMLKTASGYDVDEEETTVILDKNKQPKGYRRTTRKRHIPPSTTMQIFLAKNRMPDEFRDVNRQEVNIQGSLKVDTLAELMMEEYGDEPEAPKDKA